MIRAVFLDRDGVILPDHGLLTDPEQLQLFPYTAGAIKLFRSNGYHVFVITNQTVIARGLISEEALDEIHQKINDELKLHGAHVDEFFYCPHHPNATLEEYRTNCDCRKPKPGLLLSASKKWEVNLNQSIMIGDRGSDIQAGKSAGCKTILLKTGQHEAKPIESPIALDSRSVPDEVYPNLYEYALKHHSNTEPI